MGLITKETLERYWRAYREINAAEKILADIAKLKDDEWHKPVDEYAPRLRDAFGHRRHFQLGVPSGENGHSLFDVSPVLAEACIRAHIDQQRARLAEANEIARLELDTDTPLPNPPETEQK